MLVYQRVLHGTLKREFQYPKAKRTYCKTCSWIIFLLDLLWVLGWWCDSWILKLSSQLHQMLSSWAWSSFTFPNLATKTGWHKILWGWLQEALLLNVSWGYWKWLLSSASPDWNPQKISPLYLHPQYIHMKWLVPKGFLPLSQIEGVRNHIFWRRKNMVLGPASRTRRRGKRPTCGKLKSWKFWRPLEMRWSSKFIAPWQTLTDCGWGYGRGMKRIQYLSFVKTKILFFGDNDKIVDIYCSLVGMQDGKGCEKNILWFCSVS